MTRKKQRATGIFGLFLAILCLTIILGCPGPSVTEQERSIAGTFTYPYLYSALGSTTGELSAGQAVEDGTKKTVPVISEGPVWKDADANQKVNLKYTITPPSGDKGGPGKVEINESTGAVTIGEDATATDNGTYTITVEGKGLYTLLGTKITASIEIRVADKAIAGRLGYSDESGASVITVSHGGSDEGSKGVAWTGNENSKDQTVAYTITSKDGSAAPAGIAVKADGTVTVATNVAVKHSGIYKVIASGTGDYGGRSTTEVEIKIEPAANLPSGATKDNLSFSYENISVAAKIPLKATQVEPKWAAETGDVNAILSDLDVTYSMGEDAEGAATKLPAGMTLDAKTGEISGQANIEDKEDKTPTELSAVIKATLSSSNYTGTLDLDPVTVTFTITTAKTPLPEAAFSYGAALEVAYGSGSSSKSGEPVWDVAPEVEKDENGDYPFLAAVEYSIAKQGDGSTSDRILVDPAGIVTVTKDAGVADNGNYLVTAKAKADSTYSGEITADVPITIKINTFDLKDAAIKAVNPINVFYGDPGATGPLSLTGTPTTLVVGTDVTYSITKDGSIVTGIIVDGTVLRTANTVQVASSGTYTVTATGIGNYTGSITQDVTVSIQKRLLSTQTLTAPGSVTTTYGTAGTSSTVASVTGVAGGTPPEVTYTIKKKDGSIVDGVTMDGAKVNVTATVSAASSGDYTVTATAKNDDPNYRGTVSEDVVISIGKKDISALTLTPPSSVTTTYGTAGTSSTAASVAGVTGGTPPEVTYSIKKKDGSIVDGITMVGGKVNVAATVPAALDETYTVTATVAATDPNYEGSASDDVGISIGKKDLSDDDFNAPSDIVDAPYGEVATSEIAASFTVAAGVLSPEVEYTIIAKGGSTVDGITMVGGKINVAATVTAASSGDYTVIATAKATDPNYEGSAEQDVKITITEPDISSLTLKVPGNPMEVIYGIGGSTHRGSVSLTSADGVPVTLDVDYSIVKKDSGAVVEGVSISNDGKIVIGKTVPAAPVETTYTVTATGKGSNPKSKSADVTIIINKYHIRSLNFTPPDPVSTIHGTAKDSDKAASISQVDGGTAPNVIYSIKKGSNLVPGVTMTADGKVSVAGTAPADAQFASTQYTVTATAAPTDPNYTGSTTANVIVRIQRKALGVEDFKVPGEVIFTYGKAATSDIVVSHDGDGSTPGVTYSITSKDGGNVPGGVTLTADGKISITDTVSVADSGDYTVQVVAGDGNYFGSVELNVKVTIQPAPFADLGVSFFYPSPTITTQAGTEKLENASFVPGKLKVGTPIEYSLSPNATGISVAAATGTITIGTNATVQTETEFTVTVTVDPSDNYDGGTFDTKIKITVTS